MYSNPAQQGTNAARLDNRIMLQHNITSRSLGVFLIYAKDAGNWGGQPLVGGNVGGSLEDNGNLTQLKKVGLITTQEEKERGRPACVWIRFTDKGKALAAEYGIEIE